jgi:predicted DNA-binding protein with PD1-like motif
MKLYAFRLKPGQDLKEGINKFAVDQGIKAGFIVTCVGGLKQAVLRMAGATPDRQDIRTFKEDFEIVSLVGTVSVNGSHLHLAVSDKVGKVYGGHLKAGCLVDPTAEIVIGEDESSAFTRQIDQDTGFKELIIKVKNK